VIFLEEELDKWFYNIFMKVWNNLVKKAEMEHTKFSEAVAKQFSGLKIDEDSVKKVLREITLPEKFTSWTSEQIMKFVGSLRKETKPMIVAANKCDSKNAKENLEKLKKEFPSYLIVPCSADCELALRQASKADLINYIPGESKFEYVKELNAKQKDALDKIQREVLEVYGSTGVQNILNKAVF
jgi:ribosome-binding ATPase YchF (GTP1/OBG family)